MTTKMKGSMWRKWDLHFHTPSSYDYSDKSITNEQIIESLQANEISVVAITDHHVIDTERIKKLQELGKEKQITILPGIEFLSDARGNDPIHFIAIFAENSNLSFIWKQIESGTEIRRIEGEGKKINEVYCDLLDTAKLIKELGGLISIHAGTKSNTIDNITNSLPQGVAQKTDIAQVIDIFELGKESDCAVYNQLINPFLKRTIDKHVPLIICSDNHKATSYSTKQNLWIKADPSFEGLKQVVFEPEHRVKIQKEKPDFKEDKLVIDEVRYISSNGKFTDKVICLNDNLNVIIGGKSSGKSILLFNIAKTLLTDREFLKKQMDGKYDLRVDDVAYNFEIRTKGGFAQLMYRSENENSIIPEIKYIPQNYLVKLAEPEENKTGNALNKIIRDLINEDRDSMLYYDDFIAKVKANDRKREGLIDSYFEIKERINQLESQLTLTTNRDILEGNINSNTKKVDELNKSIGLNQDQITRFNSLQISLELNTQKRTQAYNDYKKINEFNSETLSFLNSLKSKRQLLSDTLENFQIKQFFDESYTQLDTLIQNTEFIITNFQVTKDETGNNVFTLDGPVAKVFKQLKDASDLIKDELSPFINNDEVKKQIEIINKSISEDKISLLAINQLSKEITDNRNALVTKKEAIFKLYKDNFNVYTEVINALKTRTVDLEKDKLNISGIPAFNFPKFRKSIAGLSDGRKRSYTSYTICNEDRDSLFTYNLQDLLTELMTMFGSIAELGTYTLSSKVDKRTAIKVLLEDYFFDYWQIEYKNDKLGKMSTGKASFVILMLIVGLSKSKAPILIDQPEDNLDNRSITTDLVEYLKKKKLERQIILVTHNANVVVNADAENIIVAHQKGQSEVESNTPFLFDYINGSLENTFPMKEGDKDILKSMGIREHIADIVEGGKLAFQKREEKYGFKTFK